ncbi:hypothetical protein SEVIR_7G186851v4 [Setaria viridis]
MIGLVGFDFCGWKTGVGSISQPTQVARRPSQRNGPTRSPPSQAVVPTGQQSQCVAALDKPAGSSRRAALASRNLPVAARGLGPLATPPSLVHARIAAAGRSPHKHSCNGPTAVLSSISES